MAYRKRNFHADHFHNTDKYYLGVRMFRYGKFHNTSSFSFSRLPPTRRLEDRFALLPCRWLDGSRNSRLTVCFTCRRISGRKPTNKYQSQRETPAYIRQRRSSASGVRRLLSSRIQLRHHLIYNRNAYNLFRNCATSGNDHICKQKNPRYLLSRRAAELCI